MSAMAGASEEVARIQQEVAMEQVAWAKEQDTMNRATLNRVLDIQLPVMEENARAAKMDRERYETMFQPLEENLINEFQDFASPERILREQGKAIADVSSTFDASRRNALQRLESYGVDPSQTRNAALDVDVRTKQAAAQAAAASSSRSNTEAVGRSLRAEAINIGRGMPSQIAGAYGTALQAGNSAVGGSTSTTNAGTSANAGAGQYFQGAMQGYQNSANITSQGFQNQMASWQAGSDQTMGQLNMVAGAAGAMAVADGGAIPSKKGAQALPVEGPGPVATGIGDGSGIDDAVPAQLSDGEFVIPADVVRMKGEEFFNKLLEKYHVPAEQQRAAA
jgi:hypothetical protein